MHGLRRSIVPLVALLLLAVPATASAVQDRFTEETAAANWAVPYQCSDGSTATGRLLVQPTSDFEAPAKVDPDPTVRVQFLVVCSGFSYSWGIGAAPATITIDPNLKSASVTASFTVRDSNGATHPVSIDVSWTGVGPVQTTVNTAGSMRKQRAATATGTVLFDGSVFVSGAANGFVTPFIRVDTEK